MSISVSVVMPVFNAEKYLRESIESILNQSDSDFELLLVNDASTDRSKDIMLEYVKRDTRVRYFENTHNVGVSESSNIAIREATGVFIAKQDADDISLPNRLAVQSDFLENHPDIDLITSQAIFFDSEGKREWISGQELTHDEIRMQLLFGCPIMNPTLMVRRDFLFRNGLFYNPRFQGPEDYDLFCKAVQIGKLHSIGQALLKYRIHQSEQRLNHYSRKAIYKSGTAEIRKHFFSEIGIQIPESLLTTYEDIFYNDLILNRQSCLKTVLFYRKVFDQIRNNLSPGLKLASVNTYFKLIFYNSFYRFSRIGTDALFIYLIYGRENFKMTLLQEFKFAIKSLIRK